MDPLLLLLLIKAASASTTITTELPCNNCVYKPAICSCLSKGQCQAEDRNIVDQFSNIPLERECAALCLEHRLCKLFTYFGDNSALR